ncbi:unnamed protein product, partial [Allacma fusca]
TSCTDCHLHSPPTRRQRARADSAIRKSTSYYTFPANRIILPG